MFREIQLEKRIYIGEEGVLLPTRIYFGYVTRTNGFKLRESVGICGSNRIYRVFLNLRINHRCVIASVMCGVSCDILAPTWCREKAVR
jgi:hypothetical protein